MNHRTNRHMLRIIISLFLVTPFAIFSVAVSSANALEEREFPEVDRGGLIVRLGVGDGERLVALGGGENRLVQGLDRSAERVAAARELIRSKGLYGRVSAIQLVGSSLPFTDNLVNLLIAESPDDVSMDEIMRVLAPRGVAYIHKGDDWSRLVKPVPDDIDEWTHYLHDATNNAVADDRQVGPPRHHQWVVGPRWARSHDHLATVSAIVSSSGRIFYIIDEGMTASIALKPRWKLVARDAFSGVLLWKRSIELWEGYLRDFRTGPSDLARRLVAIGERVYVTLGYGEPITVLDAASGETLATYESTRGTLEMIVDGEILLAVVGDRIPETTDTVEHSKNREGIWHWWPIYGIDLPVRHLTAIDVKSGRTLWTKKDEQAAEMLPTTLASAGGKVYFQNYEELVALDAASGQVVWHSERKVNRRRPAWSTPTVVVHGDVILSADRSESALPPRTRKSEKKTQWVVSSVGGVAPAGRMIAFSTDTGRRLWEAPCKECYNAPVDILITDGLVWSGNLVSAREPGITQGLDLLTGEVRRTRPGDQKFFRILMGHQRCHRNKATSKYLVLGRDGIEFIDIKTGQGHGNHWVRGACQYGVMPCNGLVYAPPHSCACHIETKLNSFLALAATREAVDPSAERPRLVKGPAYGATATAAGTTAASDWPTYRHDAARTGRASTEVPSELKQAWSTQLPAKEVKSAVAADGRVFVAAVDQHAIYALDAADGRIIWTFTADGPIDSPPTIHDGAAIFGSSDGWIYSVRASDGVLAWRLRAGPSDRRIVAYDRIESPWSVHGSTLVKGGMVYAVAGRTSFLDGGMNLLKIDAATGRLISETAVEAGLPDVLSSTGDNLFLRHKRFDLDGNPQSPTVPHLYCSAGLLDDDWWHRTFWQIGTRMGSNWGGWPNTARTAPVGRILVHDENSVYGFRRSRYHLDGSHVGMGPMHYYLYARNQPMSAGSQETRWTARVPLLTRAMVLTGENLFVAGPPDLFVQVPADGAYPYTQGSEEDRDRQEEALAGRLGGILQVVSTGDGSKLAQYELDSPPNWDSMIAAGDSLYLTTMDGKVICMRGISGR